MLTSVIEWKSPKDEIPPWPHENYLMIWGKCRALHWKDVEAQCYQGSWDGEKWFAVLESDTGDCMEIKDVVLWAYMPKYPA